MPLVWHLRLANGLRHVLRSQRTQFARGTSSVFRPLITTSHSPASEIDMNMHKSNSTYLSDLDIARTHLVSTLFSTGIERARFAESDSVIGGGDSQLFVMLASLACSFHREIKPYETYEMWTRVLSWDKKWLYVLTHFVSVRGENESGESDATKVNIQKGQTARDKSFGGKKIYATALSKCVFKKGRLTVAPEAMLDLSGLLRATDDRNDGVSIKIETTKGQAEPSADVSTVSGDSRRIHTREELETERLRGLELANKLAEMDSLHDEFEWNVPPLAQREDGYFVAMIAKVLAASVSYCFERINMMLVR